MEKSKTYVGYWSINWTEDEPNQFCLWKSKKPNKIHRVMNYWLLGTKWFDHERATHLNQTSGNLDVTG